MSLPLLIAATASEVAPLLDRLEEARPLSLSYGEGREGRLYGARANVATLGIGKVNTAAGLALAIAELQPSMVVQLGIAGAFAGSGLEIGVAAVASEEIHLDSGALAATGFEDMRALGFPLLSKPRELHNRMPVNSDLSRALAGGRLPMLPFGTSETVTGDPGLATEVARRFDVAVESMEGAAAAQVALALGVPFAELRGVSNVVGERDKAHWRLGEAVEAVHRALEAWLRRGAPSRP